MTRLWERVKVALGWRWRVAWVVPGEIKGWADHLTARGALTVLVNASSQVEQYGGGTVSLWLHRPDLGAGHIRGVVAFTVKPDEAEEPDPAGSVQ